MTDLIYRLKSYHGLPVGGMVVKHNGQEIVGDQRLSDYMAAGRSIFQLIPGPEVFIGIPDGRTLRRPVQGTAGDLKESLADELKISPNLMTLSASGLTLRDGKIHNEAQTEYWFPRLTSLLKKNLCKTLSL